jgi:hypothetical protein
VQQAPRAPQMRGLCGCRVQTRGLALAGAGIQDPCMRQRDCHGGFQAYFTAPASGPLARIGISWGTLRRAFAEPWPHAMCDPQAAGTLGDGWPRLGGRPFAPCDLIWKWLTLSMYGRTDQRWWAKGAFGLWSWACPVLRLDQGTLLPTLTPTAHLNS